MARRRPQLDDRARRFAVALASLCRAQSRLPLAAVAEDAQCLSHASELLAILQDEKPAQRLRSPAGRRPVHDRAWAHSCLLDIALRDPDGMPSQARLIRSLEERFAAAGKVTPGDTWMKSVVRAFHAEAREFELDAAATHQASPELRAVFPDVGDFLRFRRAKALSARAWTEDSALRSQFASPEKLLEAALNKGFPHNSAASIHAHSRLPQARKVRAR